MKANFLSIISKDLRRLDYEVQDSFGWIKLLWLSRKRSVRVLLYVRCVLHGYSLISMLVRLRLRSAYDIEIFPGSTIGSGLLFPHPRDVIISPGVQLGEGVTLCQGVTIGGNQKKSRSENGKKIFLPKIGNNVWIGPNVVIGGPIKINDHVLIGANSVVTKDIPSNSMVIGFNKISQKKILIDNVNSTWSETN
tara:strand:- start:503 stop:1081 length:579 start_codon:yes stop_codon:yes gene_type:complete